MVFRGWKSKLKDISPTMFRLERRPQTDFHGGQALAAMPQLSAELKLAAPTRQVRQTPSRLTHLHGRGRIMGVEGSWARKDGLVAGVRPPDAG